MDVERRQHERQKLYSPEYFDMGAENGGMIVDIGEDGLGFQAVGRVEKGTEIAVSFSLGAGYRISARARIAWVGSNGNSGGTTFTRLPADSRSIIREWVTKTAEATAAREAAAVVEAEIAAPENEPETEEAPLIIERVETPRASLPVPSASMELATETPVATQSLVEPIETPAQEAIQPEIQAVEPHSAQPEISPTAIPQTTIPPDLQPDLQQEMQPDVAAAAESVVPSAVLPPAPSIAESVAEPVTNLSAQASENRPGVTQTPAAPPRTEPPRPLFPPRNTGELFSRSPWISGQSLPEEERSHKGLTAVIVIFLIVAASAASVPYIRSHRQEIGARIESMGRSVAGAPAQNASAPSRQPSQQSAPQSSQRTWQLPRPSRQTAAPPSNTPSSSGGAIPANPSSAPTKPRQVSASSASTAAFSPQLHPSTPATNASSGATAQNPPVASAVSAIPPANGSTSLLAIAGQTEFQQAQKYLNGTGGVAADPAEAAELFWRSLEKGNTAAAIPLAELYLQGKGVSRSCLQARILLTTASNKGNAEASQKLGQLPENCE